MLIYDHSFLHMLIMSHMSKQYPPSYHKVCAVFIFSLNYVFENCSYKKLNSYILLLQYMV